MKNLAVFSVLLLLTGCASPLKAPSQGNPIDPSVPNFGSASGTSAESQPSSRTASIQLNGEVYKVTLPTGADNWVSAVATGHGIVWSGPQGKTGEGLDRHPIEPVKLYLSPFQKGGRDLSYGAQELFTFPLTIPYAESGPDQYVTAVKIADAGDWAGILLALRTPGNNQGPFRLDAVNLKTREHRIITDAHLSGGMHFTWRAEPGRVFWEQESLTASGEPLVVSSKVIDLETGKLSDVPPGTAKKG